MPSPLQKAAQRKKKVESAESMRSALTKAIANGNKRKVQSLAESATSRVDSLRAAMTAGTGKQADLDVMRKIQVDANKAAARMKR